MLCKARGKGYILCLLLWSGGERKKEKRELEEGEEEEEWSSMFDRARESSGTLNGVIRSLASCKWARGTKAALSLSHMKVSEQLHKLKSLVPG